MTVSIPKGLDLFSLPLGLYVVGEPLLRTTRQPRKHRLLIDRLLSLTTSLSTSSLVSPEGQLFVKCAKQSFLSPRSGPRSASHSPTTLAREAPRVWPDNFSSRACSSLVGVPSFRVRVVGLLSLTLERNNALLGRPRYRG